MTDLWLPRYLCNNQIIVESVAPVYSNILTNWAYICLSNLVKEFCIRVEMLMSFFSVRYIKGDSEAYDSWEWHVFK